MMKGGILKRSAQRSLDPTEASVRRVGWQLAGLTVVLLATLLVVLSTAEYFTTEQALTTAGQTAIRDRATAETGHLLDAHMHAISGFADGEHESESGGIFIIFATNKLVPHGDSGPFGSALPDPAAARLSAKDGQPRFSKVTRSDKQEYLIYTLPVSSKGQLLGLIQTGTARGPYEASLHALLERLLLLSLLGLIASAGISAVLAQRALGPIRRAMQRQRNFVADAAHELRTPLTIIRTSAELGLSSEASIDQQAALEQTLVEVNHLRHLVDDLSLLARIDTGTMSLSYEPVDLTQLVHETVDGVEILGEEQGISLAVQEQGTYLINGDRQRLRQLLMILLDNALKFTPRGGAITVGMERQGNRVCIHVRDTGPGIDPHDLPHLFDRFYRADRSRAQEGSGLGLAIGRWIVEAHSGNITAYNAPRHGAIFTITLPLASSQTPHFSQKRGSLEVHPPYHQPQGTLNGRRTSAGSKQ